MVGGLDDGIALPGQIPRLLKDPEKVIVFSRSGLLFELNFHPEQSLTNVLVPVPEEADYAVELTTDDHRYGGFCQIHHQIYPTKVFDGKHYVELYLPARTAMVLREKKRPKPAANKAKKAKKAK